MAKVRKIPIKLITKTESIKHQSPTAVLLEKSADHLKNVVIMFVMKVLLRIDVGRVLDGILQRLLHCVGQIPS